MIPTSEETGQLYDLRLIHPSLTVISGPVGSGKTSLAVRIIKDKNRIIQNGKDIQNIIVFYHTYQPLYDQLLDLYPQTKLIERSPTVKEFTELTESFADEGGSICLVDDYMNQIDSEFSEIATVSSRHNKCFTIMLFQSIFPPSKYARLISLNATYYHIFPDPRNIQSVSNLTRQMLGSNSNYVVSAYKHVTEKPYSYFTIDLSQRIPQYLRFRSNIFMDNGPMKCYIEDETNWTPGQKRKRRK